MPGQAWILAGPARSGKTHRLITRYCAALHENSGKSWGETLWLSPTARGAFVVRQQLIDAGMRGCFDPNVTTFGRFAQAILDYSPEPVRPLSEMARRQLLRRIVDERTAKKELAYFAGIAHTAGFIDLVDALIRELKRSEVWPEDFAAACRARGMTAKDRELLAIYGAYQQALVDRQLYDAEGRFWSARTLWKQGCRGPFSRLRLIVVDGFTDFTWTQHEILSLLAEHADEFVVSLPLEREKGRSELFAKPRGTLETLSKNIPGLRVEWTERPAAAGTGWPAMRRIEKHLFGNPREHLPELLAHERESGIEIIAAAQQVGELRAVAARIKALLLDGDGGRPVRPSEIAVVFRTTGDIAPLAREVFVEYGIPFSLDERPSLDTCPLIKALVATLRLAVEDWPFRQVVAALGNDYLRPRGTPRDLTMIRVAADRAVRAMQIPTGSEKLVAALRRSAEGATSVEREDSGRRPIGPSAALALPLVVALADALAALPARGTPLEWASAIERLAVALGMIEPPLTNETSEMDRLGWERLISTLRAASRLADWLGAAEVIWTREEMFAHLLEIIAVETVPLPIDDTGRVRVISAQEARTLSGPYLFVAGLAEQAFPRRQGEDALYHEADRRRLVEAGARMAQHGERASEEMLLFYEVVTRATRRVVLSYPAMNEKAEPLLPSPYLQEIERLLGGAASKAEVGDLRPIPQAKAGYSLGDRRVLAVHEALEGREDRLAALIAAEPTMARNLIAALRINQSRRGSEFGALEGVFGSAALKARLAETFGPGKVWSATALETYGLCPLRFLYERVLSLEGPPELELDDNPFRRGSLLHEVLARVHRKLNEIMKRPASPAERVEAFERGFLEQLDAMAEQLVRDRTIESALVSIDLRMMRELAKVYIAQHGAFDEDVAGGLRPAHFEVAFGVKRKSDDDDDVDPLSVDAPLVLAADGEEVKFTGRIDRIDIMRDPATGEVQFGIVDYKSGRKQAGLDAAADAGSRLQLDLYTLAAEQVIFAGQNAIARYNGYWHVTDAKGFHRWQTPHEARTDGWQASAAWTLRRARLAELVVGFVRGIRAGQFPVFSTDEKCTSYCEFSRICRVNQARSLEKIWRPSNAPSVLAEGQPLAAPKPQRATRKKKPPSPSDPG